MRDKINLDLVPEENKLILDLHGLTIDETRILLDRELESIQKHIIAIILLHGYYSGEKLKRYVKEEYNHNKIRYKDWPHNPGVTYYILKERN